jgi:hypothetical protein
VNSSVSTTETGRTGREAVFFLSYAHSTPSPEGPETPSTDVYVHRFFEDLKQGVGQRSRVDGREPVGVVVRPGADERLHLAEAIESAKVFVPLYSPWYFRRSWPMHEHATFRRHLEAAGIDPDRRVVPVVWTPFPSWRRPVEVINALSSGPQNPAYQKNGMGALLRLDFYRDAYLETLAWFADRIVAVAGGATEQRLPAPPPDEVTGSLPTGPGFLIGFLSTDVGGEGDRTSADSWWRPAPGGDVPPVADNARSLVDRLGFTASLAELSDVREDLQSTPGVLILGASALSGARTAVTTRIVADLPPWVVPVILMQPDDARAREDSARRLKKARGGPVQTFGTMDALLATLPGIIARVRRTFLRRAPVYPPPHTHGAAPPRLRDGIAESPEERRP